MSELEKHLRDTKQYPDSNKGQNMRKLAKFFNGLADNYYTAILLKNVKPIDINNSEYLFLFSQVKSSFAEKLYPLVSRELSTKGIPSCFLYKNNMLSHHYPRLHVNGHEISNSFVIENRRFVKSVHGQRLYFAWTIDPENGKIEAEGINFFSIIENTLREMQKRYNVFYTDADNNPTYTELVQTCDLLLKYFLLLKHHSKKNKQKIRIVGWEIFYIPNGIFKMLCDRFSENGDIEFIELASGYISYFGQHHLKASYISCSNLTKTKSSSAWIVSKEEFAATDTSNIDLDELLKPVSGALEKHSSQKIADNQKEVIKMVEQYRSQGKKIFVLFAHLFYDTPLNDKSSAFDGMCDWIEQTVDYFQGKEDLLLLKPHPVEFRKEFPKKTPNETLASFLSNTKLSNNIIVSEPHLFSVGDLSPLISCGLIWRSSVAMELTFLGVPSIIAGNPYFKVLDLNFAKDKLHYFQMIANSQEIDVTDKQKMEVAKFLYLTEQKHIHIDCISYDTKLRKFYWNRNALRKYLRNGDDKIRSVVEDMLV